MSHEAGQIIFGGHGKFEISEIGGAAVHQVIAEIERVFWNLNQRQWESSWRGEDPKIPGITWNGYQYPEELPKGEETDGTGLRVALSVDGYEDVGLRWYKYPGRGMTTQCEMAPDRWSAWLESALKLIRAHERAQATYLRKS